MHMYHYVLCALEDEIYKMKFKVFLFAGVIPPTTTLKPTGQPILPTLPAVSSTMPFADTSARALTMQQQKRQPVKTKSVLTTTQQKPKTSIASAKIRSCK